jgi:hypothetical protein
MEDDPDSASLEANMEYTITAFLGPMGRLLRRLRSFEASALRLPEGLSGNEIRLLKEGLEELYSYLKNLPEADLDPSFTPKWWIKEVRELSYDTEDFFDEVMESGAGDDIGRGTSAPLSTIFGIISKPKQCLPQIAEDFSHLMARVYDARERCHSFQFAPETPIKPEGGQAGISHHMPELSLNLPMSTAPIVDVQLDTIGRGIFGIKEPMKKLVNLIAFRDDNQLQLKVVPIFGSTGIGKTTIARTIYRQYGGEFQCQAFVRVSRNPDMRRILTCILSQIKAPEVYAFGDSHDLIDRIIKHLQGKRYFLIISRTNWYV